MNQVKRWILNFEFMKKQINWTGGRNGTGYITDWQPAKPGAKDPEVGTALYVATKKD